MSRYNNTLIATAIRPDAKLGKLTVSRIGKYYAFTEDLDGFSSVEVKPQQLTPTEKDFYCGNPNKRTQVFDETVTDIVLDVSASFPNLSTVIVGNTEQVVTGLDTMIGSLQGVTFVVPNSLQADYVIAYPNLTFTSWVFQIEFTIPYVGDSELTAEYVKFVVEHSSGDVAIVDKVIVPSDFTSFETGVFDYIFLKFPNCEEVDYGIQQLPSEYQEVEYIESNGTQYIDTGYSPTISSDTDVYIENEHYAIFGNDDRCVGGVRNNPGSYTTIKLPNYYNDKIELSFFGVDGSMTAIHNQRTKIILESKNGETKIIYGNNLVNGTYDYLPDYNNLSIYIFALNNRNVPQWYFHGRLYYLLVKENNSLVRNFLPCYRKSDNEIGLYDLVGNQFYTNAGTGTFLKGRDVNFGISRPALSTCHIYHDENTSHTLTAQIVQETLTKFPEYADCEKVVVDEWFTDYSAGTLDAIFTQFEDLEEIESPWLNGTKTDGMEWSVVGSGIITQSVVSESLSRLANNSIITNYVNTIVVPTTFTKGEFRGSLKPALSAFPNASHFKYGTFSLDDYEIADFVTTNPSAGTYIRGSVTISPFHSTDYNFHIVFQWLGSNSSINPNWPQAFINGLGDYSTGGLGVSKMAADDTDGWRFHSQYTADSPTIRLGTLGLTKHSVEIMDNNKLALDGEQISNYAVRTGTWNRDCVLFGISYAWINGRIYAFSAKRLSDDYEGWLIPVRKASVDQYGVTTYTHYFLDVIHQVEYQTSANAGFDD